MSILDDVIVESKSMERAVLAAAELTELKNKLNVAVELAAQEVLKVIELREKLVWAERVIELSLRSESISVIKGASYAFSKKFPSPLS